jgi:hypothetical protein
MLEIGNQDGALHTVFDHMPTSAFDDIGVNRETPLQVLAIAIQCLLFVE